MQQYEDHDEQITAMCIDRSQTSPYFIATGDANGQILMRDIRINEGVRELGRIETGAKIAMLKQSLHSDHLICAGARGLLLYEKSGSEAGIVPMVNCTSVDSDGVFALTGKESGCLELWDLMKSNMVQAWENVTGVTATLVSPDADCFLVGNAEGVLYHIR